MRHVRVLVQGLRDSHAPQMRRPRRLTGGLQWDENAARIWRSFLTISGL